MEPKFPYLLQHKDLAAKRAKWIVQIKELDYMFQIEDITRACLGNVLTHRCHEKRAIVKPKDISPPKPQLLLEDAYTLHFDGVFGRKTTKLARGIVVHDHLGGVLIKNKDVKGDAMLLIEQVQGTRACKDSM